MTGIAAIVVLGIAGAAVVGAGHERRDSTAATAQAQRPVNPDAAVLADFAARVQAYVELRNKAVENVPDLEETADPARIAEAAAAQAERIRAARANAKPGDIFTPPVRAKFRRLLAPELKGEDGRDARAVLKDDAPASVPFTVNARYPKGAPLPTLPANLLMNLPLLPEPLEYRIVDRHLILLDTRADIIVDYMMNAIR